MYEMSGRRLWGRHPEVCGLCHKKTLVRALDEKEVAYYLLRWLYVLVLRKFYFLL